MYNKANITHSVCQMAAVPGAGAAVAVPGGGDGLLHHPAARRQRGAAAAARRPVRERHAVHCVSESHCNFYGKPFCHNRNSKLI